MLASLIQLIRGLTLMEQDVRLLTEMLTLSHRMSTSLPARICIASISIQ